MNKSVKALLLLILSISLCLIVSVPTMATTAKIPSKPLIISAKTFSSSVALIEWKQSNNAEKYEIQVSINNGKYKKLKVLNNTYFIHNNLEQGYTYAYRVRAINGRKKSSFSKVKKITVGWVDGTELKVVSNTVSLPFTCKKAGKITSIKARKYHVRNNPVSNVRYDFEIRGKAFTKLLQDKVRMDVNFRLLRSDGSGESFYQYYIPIAANSFKDKKSGLHKMEGSIDSEGNFIFVWHQNEDSIPVDYDKVNIVDIEYIIRE